MLSIEDGHRSWNDRVARAIGRDVLAIEDAAL